MMTPYTSVQLLEPLARCSPAILQSRAMNVSLHIIEGEIPLHREPQVNDQAPWKQRFRTAMIGWTQTAMLAPTYGLVGTNLSGVGQLYSWDVPTNTLHQLTDDPQGVRNGLLAPDGSMVYYHRDQAGNELGHLVRVPWAGGPIEDLTPTLPPYPTLGLALNQAGNRLGAIIATPEGYHIYVLALGPDSSVGPPQHLFSSRNLITQLRFSADGTIATIDVVELKERPEVRLLALDLSSGATLAEMSDGAERSVHGGQFAPMLGDDRLVATTDHTDVKRPIIWNPRTGERIDVVLSDLAGDVEAWAWTPDGEGLLLCHTCQAVQQLYRYDLRQATLTPLQHPAGNFWNAYFAPDGRIFTQWSDPAHPPQLIALDSLTGTQTRTVLSAGSTPSGHAWRSITFPSSDGQMIQGWLGLPEGDGPFPTILHLHGGPRSVATAQFAPESQLWIDHGFAFFSINYRGSITFGRDFERRILGDLGHWEVEDTIAARAWLVQQQIAQPDQVMLMGWSYGGYLTLLALGKAPTLWAGGMAGTAITDWVAQYNGVADTLKGYTAVLLGGTPEQRREQYLASSPLTYVEQVAAPVLLIQGRNDTRCPAAPVEEYAAQLAALGKVVELHWFDAGHRGLVVEREIAHHELMLKFAYRILEEHGYGDHR